MFPSHPILIAGAGIGGLALGLALRRAGLPVSLYEKAPALRPVGWGLQLAPNGMRALRELGLDEAVAASGQLEQMYRLAMAYPTTGDRAGE